jgi:prepilin-type processing-associated H-X9-DG protein
MCVNNIKQLSIAVHTLHGTHNRLPQTVNTEEGYQYCAKIAASDFWDPLGPGIRQVWRWNHIFQILPYVEQQAIYDDYTARIGSLDAWRSEVQFKNSAFLCPSDSNKNLADRYLNYLGCRGDLVPAYQYDPGDLRGVFRKGRGANGEPGSCDFAVISDGLSNTLMWSEAAMMGSTYSSTNVPLKGFLVHVNFNRTTGAYPKECASKQSLGTMITSPSIAVNGAGPGSRMFDGCGNFAMFHAILPPNYPSCAIETTWQRMEGSNTIHTASSYHPGGVNASMADASVRFFSNTIDPGSILTDLNTLSGLPSSTANFPAAYSGPSFWGIWGALGSTGGGESKSIE